ncbi:MAG: hypothetical protein ACFNJQ_02550, partial [Scardovia wiggsiae]
MSWEWRLADSRRTGRHLYGDEKIPPQPPAEKTPKLLRAMRSLVKTSTNFWQSRSELFLVRLLDALVTLKLVLVTVLTVSNYSPHL